MCYYPQWRVDMKRGRLFFPPSYDSRIHNGGVIIQRPEYESLINKNPVLDRFIAQIPCGKCIECRLEYSRQWANRCVLESKEYEHNSFVTLTYSDEYLEFNHFVDPESGEISICPELRKKHVQDFMKRLRKEYSGKRIRFFGSGEYGAIGARPHYHIILFNHRFDDEREFYRKNGYIVRRSPTLEKLWTFGLSSVADVNWDTCAYVARYVMKKRKGKTRKEFLETHKALFPQTHPWQEEFTLMSRKPGLARDYYDRNKDVIYSTDEIFVPDNGEVRACKPARYFDKIFDMENHDRFQTIKEKRIQAQKERNKVVLSQTDLNEEEYLQVKENAKKAQINALKREL